MILKNLTDIALKAGTILLTSGAEIYRVEDTITRICRSYGAECENFVLPTGIFITASISGERLSLTKRIRQRSIDLYKIEQVNNFSRALETRPLSYEEALSTLNGIDHTRQYNFALRIAMVGTAAFVFTQLFKGTYREGFAAFFIGILSYALKEWISKGGFFEFFEYFLAGAAAGMGSLATVARFSDLNIYRVLIGAVIILLPGVAITNGIKDALFGDIVSSLSRLGEAVFVVSAVGAGAGIVLSLGLRWALI